MKKNLSISLIFLGLSVWAQDQNQNNPNLRWVSAKSGLRMRQTPDLNGVKMNTVPYGGKVIMLTEQGADVFLADTFGKWTKVKWGSEVGWVFGGFLSNVHPNARLDGVENEDYGVMNNLYTAKWGESLSLCRTEINGSRMNITEDGEMLLTDEIYDITASYFYEKGIAVRINRGYEWGSKTFEFDAKLYSVKEIFGLACSIYAEKYKAYLEKKGDQLILPTKAVEWSKSDPNGFEPVQFKAYFENGIFKSFNIDEGEGCSWDWSFSVNDDIILFGDGGGC